jgi:hypothetical protein
MDFAAASRVGIEPTTRRLRDDQQSGQIAADLVKIGVGCSSAWSFAADFGAVSRLGLQILAKEFLADDCERPPAFGGLNYLYAMEVTG